MTLSPFRWPGSKAKLLPIIMPHLDKIMIGRNEFADAFIGGGSVLLSIAVKYPKIKLFCNDKDINIYNFWKIIASDDFNKLLELLSLMEAKPTIEKFYKLRETPPSTDVEHAYHGIFFNRTTFSGIASSGPIGGKEQKSKYTVNCRYNFPKLKKKILACHELLVGRTTIENKDFSEYEPLINSDMPLYADAPYVLAGRSLYNEYMTELEHQQLGSVLLNRKNWVSSYDDHSLVKDIYKDCNIFNTSVDYCINGVKKNWKSKNELIIVPKI